MLTKAGVKFEVHSYAHDPRAESYGMEAAELLGLNPDRVFKTLVVQADAQLVVAVVGVSGQLDLKAVAAAVGAKKASMAEPVAAQRSTGYVVGGISPLGQKRELVTVIDAAVLEFETVFVSGGKRGLDLEMHPDDLVALTKAKLAQIRR